MPITYLLRLVSDRGGEQLRGFGKDPGWAGWIPIQWFAPAHFPIVTGSSGAASAGEAAPFLGDEVRFLTKPQDLDVTALQQWFLRGEPVSAKLNAVPAAPGEDGYQLVFDGAVVSYFRATAAEIEFTLNFDTMERRYLMRYR